MFDCLPSLDQSHIDSVDKGLTETTVSYRQMVEQASDGIIIHDPRHIYFVNRSFRHMFGIDRDASLESFRLHRLLAPDTRRSFFETLKAAQSADGEPFIIEGRGLRSTGEAFELELSTFATHYHDRPVFQTVVRDITHRKDLEQKLLHSERLAATGKLAFNIAHEINNPLGGIVTYTHLLLEDLADDASADDLSDTADKILKLARRCQIIVAALLDFAHDETDRRENVDINEVVNQTLDLLEGHAIMQGLEVDQQLGDDLPPLRADRTKIEQVFMNLVVNAAEAMDGHGRLTLSTETDTHGETIIARIHDTGQGITADHLKRVFDPFFSTKPRGRGTGLGLAISHGIVKQHKGTIEVESTVGSGSTFTIKLPCE
jgi:PAS domain S-box-containing protein